MPVERPAPEPAPHAHTYWEYEYAVAHGSLMPLLAGWGVLLKGASVVDVGCGEGGGLCAMHDGGAVCRGFDNDAYRIRNARTLRGDRAVEFEIGDLYAAELPSGSRRFDLVVLHDVFEHLEEKDRMMGKLRDLAAPQGRILITFPPYYSAYGAHQQQLRRGLARLPFIHLLPFAVSRILPRLKGEHPATVAEVTKLARLRMGMRKFEEIVRGAGLRIEGKQAYLISPNHIRFGLKPIPAGPLGELSVLGEVLSSGVVYLLAPREEGTPS
ncbi:MAG: methyltransferase domain-containing protein [Bacteroidota bacterium]